MDTAVGAPEPHPDKGRRHDPGQPAAAPLGSEAASDCALALRHSLTRNTRSASVKIDIPVLPPTDRRHTLTLAEYYGPT